MRANELIVCDSCGHEVQSRAAVGPTKPLLEPNEECPECGNIRYRKVYEVS